MDHTRDIILEEIPPQANLMENSPKNDLARKVLTEDLSQDVIEKVNYVMNVEKHKQAVKKLHDLVISNPLNPTSEELLELPRLFPELRGTGGKNHPYEVLNAVHHYTHHSTFGQIVHQVQTLSTISDKYLFLSRKAYEMDWELGEESRLWIGQTFSYSPIFVKRALEAYGVHLLCPYFREDAVVTRASCHIQPEPIPTLCASAHDTCRLFQQKANEAGMKGTPLPSFERAPVRVQIPSQHVGTVNIQDLHDWWTHDGKYE